MPKLNESGAGGHFETLSHQLPFNTPDQISLYKSISSILKQDDTRFKQFISHHLDERWRLLSLVFEVEVVEPQRTYL